MHLRNIFLLTLFASLTLSQEQLGSDIDGEVSSDQSGYAVYLNSNGDRVAIGSMALAQGITLPSEPSQAPIGGLGWLAALGGVLAYKKLRKK